MMGRDDRARTSVGAVGYKIAAGSLNRLRRPASTRTHHPVSGPSIRPRRLLVSRIGGVMTRRTAFD